MWSVCSRFGGKLHFGIGINLTLPPTFIQWQLEF